MLSRSKNVLISGQHIILNGFDGGQPPDKGMELLYAQVAAGALHNSGERFPPPQCHPKTRLAVQDEIIAWLDDIENRYPAMWLRGAAGAGKSAIAQMIAQICAKRGQLSSTFFFNRTSSTGRSDHKRLVATLAYQMAKNIPETQPFISSTILADPLVFEMSLESQIEALLTTPLSRYSDAIAQHERPRLIIIDGLDECSNKDDAQACVVKTFVSALSRMQHRIPHKILIASRPEHNIQAAFSDFNVTHLLRQLPLDDSWKPDEDIRTFLVDSFADIRRTHPLLRSATSRNWPTEDDLSHLIEKSSGQFVYPTVVIRHIRSARHDPIQRLDVIIKLVKNNPGRPYAELDALYAYIFSNVEDIQTVLRILCLFLLILSDPTRYPPYMDDVNGLEKILSLSKGQVEFALLDLISVVVVADSTITFLHASLPDFLMDEARSGKYYAHQETTCLAICRYCIDYIKDQNKVFCPTATMLSVNGLVYFTSSDQPMNRNIGEEVLPTFNFMESLSNEFRATQSPHVKSSLTYYGGQFLTWILTNIQGRLTSKTVPCPLSKVIMQIQDWLLQQLQAFPFSGFDNPHGLDLWIYSATYMSHPNRSWYSYLNARLIQDGNTSVTHGDMWKLANPSVEFCWTLMPLMVDHFKGFDQLSEYLVTPERCHHVARRLVQTLITSPKLFITIRRNAERVIFGMVESDTQGLYDSAHAVALVFSMTAISSDLHRLLGRLMDAASPQKPTLTLKSHDTLLHQYFRTLAEFPVDSNEYKTTNLLAATIVDCFQKCSVDEGSEPQSAPFQNLRKRKHHVATKSSRGRGKRGRKTVG